MLRAPLKSMTELILTRVARSRVLVDNASQPDLMATAKQTIHQNLHNFPGKSADVLKHALGLK
jgi:hypothetical protein